MTLNLNIPSICRWISYFSQRFAAIPQTVKLSKLVIPQGPLKAQKLRLTIHMLVPGSQKGNAVDEELLWTSKGRGMGGLERGESYTVFNFPEAIEVTGDIKVTIWTRKFSNGPFIQAFHLWFNTGFVDHTPMVLLPPPPTLHCTRSHTYARIPKPFQDSANRVFSFETAQRVTLPLFHPNFQKPIPDNASFDRHRAVIQVWDKACFDGLPSGNNLPDDFHIQTLFVGFPRVACSLSKVCA